MTDTQPDQSDWPAGQRDYPPGTVTSEHSTFHLETQDEEGRWIGPWATGKSSRDEMTMIQADGLRRNPKERQRVIEYVSYIRVAEVVGDGEGETSRDEVLARNEEIIARLIDSEKAAE